MAINFYTYSGATPSWEVLGSKFLVFSGEDPAPAPDITVGVETGDWQDGTHVGDPDVVTDACGANHANNVKRGSDTTMFLNGAAEVNINDTNLTATDCSLRVKLDNLGNIFVSSARLFVYDGSDYTEYAPGVEIVGFEQGVGGGAWITMNSGDSGLGGDNSGQYLPLADRTVRASIHNYYIALSASPESAGGHNFSMAFSAIFS